jgi:hypothetical protein
MSPGRRLPRRPRSAVRRGARGRAPRRRAGDAAPKSSSKSASWCDGLAIASAGRGCSAGNAQGCRVPVTRPATGRGFGWASEQHVRNMARLCRRVRLSAWQAQRHAHDPRRAALIRPATKRLRRPLQHRSGRRGGHSGVRAPREAATAEASVAQDDDAVAMQMMGKQRNPRCILPR